MSQRPAVVGRDRQREPRVGGRLRLARRYEVTDSPVEYRSVADHLEPDPVRMQLRHFLLQRMQEKVHEYRDFIGRAAPVLAGEREQREKFDVALDAREDDRPHRLDTAAVPGDARQHPLLRPASVAVHDDRHMPGHLGRGGNVARGAREHGFAGAGGNASGVVGGCAAAARQIAIRSVSLAASTLSISAM